MPQLTLTLSKNIDLKASDFESCFSQIHKALEIVPQMDVSTIHSGAILEDFSYIGVGNPKTARVYLQLYWLESPERILIRKSLGNSLMSILKTTIVYDVINQGLLCTPRVKIANLGELHEKYFIG
ncbi:MAG: hypothetical protein H0U70_00985 [Tatlockia sp.]|nr:hypothetical protein [Tatlockia sp.]